MQNPPELFDLELYHKRQKRVVKEALFLHDQAIEIIQERLEEVNKPFQKIGIIGAQAEYWEKKMGIRADTINLDDFLNLKEAHYDLIIHAMGLHVLNDPVGQLVQINRALAPDGMVLVCLFGGQTLQELRLAFASAESKVLGGISPRIFSMGEIRDLGGLIARAGFTQPVADNFAFTVKYDHPLKLMHDLRMMGETNVMHDRLRHLSRDLLREVFGAYPKGKEDKFPATFDLIFLTGWKAHESQQKPLRPGSAQSRLADILNTDEIPLKRD
ncbi:MAG: SAM-dependent methyltransferase [Pseudomonadota bacterium]